MITPEMTAPYVLGLLKCVRYETKHWLDRVPVLSGAKVSIIYGFGKITRPKNFAGILQRQNDTPRQKFPVRAPTPVHPTGRPSSVPPETSAPIPHRKKHGLIEERGGAFNAPPRSFRPIRINTGCARNRRPDWSRNHPGRCARSSDGPH